MKYLLSLFLLTSILSAVEPVVPSPVGATQPAWANARGKDQYGIWADLQVAGVTQRFRWIVPGTFTMGSPASEVERQDSEVQHEVTISKGYWLADSECTQGLWQAITGSNPAKFQDSKNPVEQVSWDDCQGFLSKLNSQVAGVSFRLPSEAEWEYACRAGTKTAFHFGATITPDQVNYDGKNPYGGAAKGLYRKKTVAVKSSQANAWGLYDMHGNVWEWCGDWYGDYPTGNVTDPTGPVSGSIRVYRGGSWYCNARDGRSAVRFRGTPVIRNNDLGFRLCAPVQGLPFASTDSAFKQPKVYDLKPNERILVLGDMTTHDGNTVGGYVRLVDQAIQEQVPERKAAIRAHVGYGTPLVPRNPKVRLAIAEWLQSVLNHPNAPTTVMINLGLDDSMDGEANIPNYEKWLRQHVEELRAAKMDVILCTPTLWGGLKQTKSYAESVRRVTTEMKCPLIDLYAAHAAALEQKKSLIASVWGCNGVHMNMAGEVLSASTLLQAFGLKTEWKKYQLRVSARPNGYSQWMERPLRLSRLNSPIGVEGWCGTSLIGNTKCVVIEPALPEVEPELENPKGNILHSYTLRNGHSDTLWIANWPNEQAAYAPGTKVTLKLDPTSGRVFHHWTDWDGLLPKNAPATLTIVMDGHKAVDLSYEMPAKKKGK